MPIDPPSDLGSTLGSTELAAYKSRRVNNLITFACIVVVAIVISCVMKVDINQWAQGILLLVLGRFLGYVDQAYNFEFGTTRGNKEKDTTIANLSSPTPPTPPKDPA